MDDLESMYGGCHPKGKKAGHGKSSSSSVEPQALQLQLSLQIVLGYQQLGLELPRTMEELPSRVIKLKAMQVKAAHRYLEEARRGRLGLGLSVADIRRALQPTTGTHHSTRSVAGWRSQIISGGTAFQYTVEIGWE